MADIKNNEKPNEAAPDSYVSLLGGALRQTTTSNASRNLTFQIGQFVARVDTDLALDFSSNIGQKWTLGANREVASITGLAPGEAGLINVTTGGFAMSFAAGLIRNTNGSFDSTKTAIGVIITCWETGVYDVSYSGGGPGPGGDTTAPTISGFVQQASANDYIDVTFSEGVYDNDGVSALPFAAFNSDLQFAANGGTATGCVISAITNTSGGALVGGEGTVRVHINVTGTADGNETITIRPADASSIYDAAQNPMSGSQTTGAITLKDEGTTSITDDFTGQTVAGDPDGIDNWYCSQSNEVLTIVETNKARILNGPTGSNIFFWLKDPSTVRTFLDDAEAADSGQQFTCQVDFDRTEAPAASEVRIRTTLSSVNTDTTNAVDTTGTLLTPAFDWDNNADPLATNITLLAIAGINSIVKWQTVIINLV